MNTLLTYLLTYLFTYLLTPWCRVLLEKLTGLQLVKKFHAFHGTRRFITALTNVRQLSLSWTSPIQSICPHPTSWRSILILSTHLRLGLPSGLFPSDFPTKTLYTPLSSPIRATCPAHLIVLNFITRTITMNTHVHSLQHLAQFFLQWTNLQTKFVEKITTHFAPSTFLCMPIGLFMRQCGKIMAWPDMSRITIEHGACALYAGYQRLQTRIQNN